MDHNALFQFGLTVFLFFLKPGPAFFTFIVQCLRKDPKHGISFGAGVVTADVFYFTLAVTGYAVITGQFEEFVRILFQVVGGTLLIYIGVKGFADEQIDEDSLEPMTRIEKTKDLFRSYLTGLTLAIGNPIGMVLFLSILPTIFVDFVGNPNLLLQGSLIIILFELGPYILLAFLIGHYKKALSIQTLKMMNIISSAFMICFGIFLALSTFPIDIFEKLYF